MNPSARKKKLSLTRETLRSLTPEQLNRVGGARYQMPRTYLTCYVSCYPTCEHSLCDSCYDSDCCLEPTG
jgi:hypothetical protein